MSAVSGKLVFVDLIIGAWRMIVCMCLRFGVLLLRVKRCSRYDGVVDYIIGKLSTGG